MQNAFVSDASENPMRPGPVEPIDLAAKLAARLCHDFISPVSAIVSGLDLIDDPEQQDMREDAMALIAASAKKLAALLSFSRIAFGGSQAAGTFDVRELESLTAAVFEHVRAELDWSVEPPSLGKAAARAILNLAQLGATALPVGGRAIVRGTCGDDGAVVLTLAAEGARARLRPEAVDGLEGRQFGDGMVGHWVQAYFLRAIVDQAGGTMTYALEDGAVRLRIELPAQ